MKAPAVKVKTCSQALNSRSLPFGIGSGSEAAQTITPQDAAQSKELMITSNLKRGLTAIGAFVLAWLTSASPAQSWRTTRPVSRSMTVVRKGCRKQLHTIASTARTNAHGLMRAVSCSSCGEGGGSRTSISAAIAVLLLETVAVTGRLLPLSYPLSPRE